MKRLIMQLACISSAILNADSGTFSRDRLEEFYDEFGCEEKQSLFSAGLTSACNPGVTPPSPPPGSFPPAPVTGYFPIVISNGTGLPDNQIYFLGLPNSNTQFFTLSGAFPGAMT